MKKFFGIERAYKFEWGDLAALMMIINVTLIMIIGLRAAWLGLAIACVGMVHDLIKVRRINSVLIRTASIVLNLYFISIM